MDFRVGIMLLKPNIILIIPNQVLDDNDVTQIFPVCLCKNVKTFEEYKNCHTGFCVLAVHEVKIAFQEIEILLRKSKKYLKLLGATPIRIHHIRYSV